MVIAEKPFSPEAHLVKAGIILPKVPPAPVGDFANVRQVGRLLFVSGQGPIRADGQPIRGKVGLDTTAEKAQEHARLVAINVLAALRAHCGTLDVVTGVVKLLGFVNATPEFDRHSFVIDGASKVFRDVFGATGVHARSALGVSSLPNQITVEVEAIFEHAG